MGIADNLVRSVRQSAALVGVFAGMEQISYKGCLSERFA